MECGARMAVESGERRIVTVLFADLSGFTSYSETVDPEQVRAVAQEAAGSLSGIVSRYGGSVDKIIGDCVMAIFGAPIAHEDDPERAVRCALDMQAHVSANADRFAGLGLSVGVFTGEAIYAPVGPQGEYTVLGDTVNTAARLQSAAGRGEIYVGEDTFRASEGALDFDELPPVTAKGKEKPVPAWRAAGVRGAVRTRTRARTPMVGRTLELNRLAELWERARLDARPHFACVTGSPGIGKSRLIGAFLQRARENGRVHIGRCLSYGEGITYWPIVEIIKDAAGILHDDDPDAMSGKLGVLLEDLGSEDLDELRTMAVAVANLVAAPRTPRGTYSATEISRNELHWGLRRIFQLLAAQRPLVLVVEDLHWAEPTLLDLLAYLVDDASRAPLLVLGSGRDELRKEAYHSLLDPKTNRRMIELEALSAEETEDLLAALLGGHPPMQVRAAIEAAGGNPLFVEEMVRMLRDLGAIDDEGQPTGAALGDIPIPDSLTALIGARLDRMPEEARALVGTAAVVGMAFWDEALSEISGNGPIDQGLRALEEREVIRLRPTTTVAGAREFAFTHAMLRDVAYARVPKVRRAELHERCSAWIARLPGTEDEYIEFVAHHLEQSCLLAREVRSGIEPPVLPAVTALKRSAEKSERRQGIREADRFYGRALELIGTSWPETATEIQLRRARTPVVLGDLQRATQELAAVGDTARKLDRQDLRCLALLERASIDLARGQLSEVKQALAEAAPLAELLDDLRLRVRLAYNAADLASSEGRVEDATADLRLGVALAEELDEPLLKVGGHLRLATLYFNAGRLPEAEEGFAHASTIAEALGSIRPQAIAASSLAMIRYYRGPREEAERLARTALQWFERSPDANARLETLKTLAMLANARGDHEAAERWLRDALGMARRAGTTIAIELDRLLTSTLLRQGRFDDARALAAEAVAGASDEDPFARANALLAEAYVAAADGVDETSRRRFEDAIALLEAGYPIDAADARIAYARALHRFRCATEAREQLERARAALADAGAEVLVAEIDAEIAAP